jgi:hypothetical protein
VFVFADPGCHRPSLAASAADLFKGIVHDLLFGVGNVSRNYVGLPAMHLAAANNLMLEAEEVLLGAVLRRMHLDSWKFIAVCFHRLVFVIKEVVERLGLGFIVHQASAVFFPLTSPHFGVSFGFFAAAPDARPSAEG